MYVKYWSWPALMVVDMWKCFLGFTQCLFHGIEKACALFWNGWKIGWRPFLRMNEERPRNGMFYSKINEITWSKCRLDIGLIGLESAPRAPPTSILGSFWLLARKRGTGTRYFLLSPNHCCVIMECSALEPWRIIPARDEKRWFCWLIRVHDPAVKMKARSNINSVRFKLRAEYFAKLTAVPNTTQNTVWNAKASHHL